MDMPRHSDEAKQRFRSLVPQRAEVIVKPMFGSLGAFVNGHMFAGLFGEAFGVKVAPADLDAARAVPGAGDFGPMERPMNGWVGLPQTLPDEQVAGWFDRARADAATLPPKAPKPPRAKKP